MKREKVICKTEVELLKERYVAYLKEVPTRIAPGGEALGTTIRAFIKKAE